MKIAETLLVGLLRTPLLGKIVLSTITLIQRVTSNAMKRYDAQNVRPRTWSNTEIRKIAKLFPGKTINVSAWRDEDKTGGHYRDYFTAASCYHISNYRGESGTTGIAGEVFIDLENDLPDELVGQYDVAFNHTTLEHVYDIRKAVENICRLSTDTVILVTPFLQQVHYIQGSFGDWWRPTPMCISRLLKEQGFEVIYQSNNDNPWYIVYLITVATRCPEKHAGKFGSKPDTGITLGERHFGIRSDE